MQKRALWMSAVLLAILSVAAWAADVTGTWTGTISGPDGNGFSLTYNFKQDGEKLTGSVTGPQGDPLPLIDGKVTGDKISFAINTPMNGGTKFISDGTIKGEEITVTTKMEGGEQFGGAMTLKKQK